MKSVAPAIFSADQVGFLREVAGELDAIAGDIETLAAVVSGRAVRAEAETYKPSTLRSYEQGMRRRVLPVLGAVRSADVARPDVQAFADGLLADGLNPSTISGTILPLRAILNYAVSRGELAVNPCDGLRLPAVRGQRERIADSTEAAALIAAVPEQDRAIWAAAMYGGLRLGELQALRVESIDLAAGVIHVERGWDAKEGEIETKGRSRRKVPIPAVLRDHLLDDLARSQRSGAELAFGRTPADPFDSSVTQGRADKAWEDAGLERITPHSCSHSFASLNDRRRRQREGTPDLYGPQLGDRDLRPLWPPPAGFGG